MAAKVCKLTFQNGVAPNVTVDERLRSGRSHASAELRPVGIFEFGKVDFRNLPIVPLTTDSHDEIVFRYQWFASSGRRAGLSLEIERITLNQLGGVA